MQAGRKAEGVRGEEGAPSTFFDPASREMQMLALASKSRETPSTKPLDLDAQRARSILAGSRLKLTTKWPWQKEANEARAAVRQRGGRSERDRSAARRRRCPGRPQRRGDAARRPHRHRQARGPHHFFPEQLATIARGEQGSQVIFVTHVQLLSKAPRQNARRGPHPTPISCAVKSKNLLHTSQQRN